MCVSVHGPLSYSYAIYHGPVGLRAIAERVHGLAEGMRHALRRVPFVTVLHDVSFDTVTYQICGRTRTASKHVKMMEAAGYNVRALGFRTVSLSLDETTVVCVSI